MCFIASSAWINESHPVLIDQWDQALNFPMNILTGLPVSYNFTFRLRKNGRFPVCYHKKMSVACCKEGRYFVPWMFNLIDKTILFERH